MALLDQVQNISIRIYVWASLGSQAQTSTNLTIGAEFDA